MLQRFPSQKSICTLHHKSEQTSNKTFDKDADLMIRMNPSFQITLLAFYGILVLKVL